MTDAKDSKKALEEAQSAEAHFFALHSARLLLLSLEPRDALCAAVYACRELADMAAPEGKELLPLLALIRDANRKMLESIQSVPEASLDASDDAAWSEGFVEAFALHAPRSPGSLMVLVECVLHYLGGNTAADNPLSLPSLTVPPDVQRLAHHLLSAYRKVMKARMPKSGS